ncbi:MAG: LysM peptidoglycan-binding domain-containing protein, partial [Porticoccaceae bacterium]|nr:LysM peptidoglycan-binding domain-containing protein [Porticoccaceae bacterium]
MKNTVLVTTLLALLLAGPSPAIAEDLQLKADVPERYTVKRGDTLWDISTVFLQSPW